MEIGDALKIIKEKLNSIIIETKHFKQQCEDRNLDSEKVIEIATTNKILGIVEQDENLYKIWFSYEKHKDLNIILRLHSDSVRIITVFPCYSDRRKR